MIPEEALLQPLPPVPEGFEKRLEQIATYGEKPMFRLSDGIREQQWRNGKMDTKHLFIAAGSYVKVSKTRYRRKFFGSSEFLIFPSYVAAKQANVPELSRAIETATIEKVVGIGRPCWIVEVYVKPEEICRTTWLQQRFQMLEKNGIAQRIDQLGPYPKEGRYIACFDVIDDEGNAVSPSERTLDECKRRLRIVEQDTETAEMAIQASAMAVQKFEEKQVKMMTENWVQWAGITAKRAYGGVIGKPIAVN